MNSSPMGDSYLILLEHWKKKKQGYFPLHSWGIQWGREILPSYVSTLYKVNDDFQKLELNEFF